MEDVLREQLAYYPARAGEYDESVQGIGTDEPEREEANQQWLQIVQALRSLSLVDDVLELACGTGIWTQELAQIGRRITAIDGSPEMIEINRAKHGSAAVEYRCTDLFAWEPEKQYDLDFFAFWLSHVPPSRLSDLLSKVARATKPGGRVFMVDEPKSDRNISGPNLEGLYQHRTLQNGQSFRIVKVYYDPRELEGELLQRGFQKHSMVLGKSFFSLCATRISP
jgi:demethylmenaquinone methyltransferase/2-methoxy-6-polyprenyl-1,4-benzoquinol methylase